MAEFSDNYAYLFVIIMPIMIVVMHIMIKLWQHYVICYYYMNIIMMIMYGIMPFIISYAFHMMLYDVLCVFLWLLVWFWMCVYDFVCLNFVVLTIFSCVSWVCMMLCDFVRCSHYCVWCSLCVIMRVCLIVYVCFEGFRALSYAVLMNLSCVFLWCWMCLCNFIWFFTWLRMMLFICRYVRFACFNLCLYDFVRLSYDVLVFRMRFLWLSMILWFCQIFGWCSMMVLMCSNVCVYDFLKCVCLISCDWFMFMCLMVFS